MQYYVQEWITYLRSADALLGFPLGLAGVMLMLGGWRIWKAAVVLSFALLGAVAGVLIGRDGDHEMLYAAIGCVLLGAASFPPVYYSVGVLGGIIGAGLVNYFAAGMGMTGAVLWLITAVGLIAAGALSFINLRQVIIVITAFQGAALLLSAVVTFMSQSPGLFNYFRQMAFESFIFVPFLMLVPTVVGTLLQAADANNKDFALTPR